MEGLWQAGAKVRAYDPKAAEETMRIFGQRNDLVLVEEPEEAYQQADALIIMTEWKVFRSPDFAKMKASLREPVIFDGRNIFNPEMMEELGFTYYSIGRKPIIKK